MFDDVSGRYDLLNRMMALDMDTAWRAAMARAVPSASTVVVDLCTGSGVSAHALEKTGRLVLGLDVSLVMLEKAQITYGEGSWAPWFGAADAFQLPLPDSCADAITIAFGMRNLRPHPAALAEIGRVLESGGVLVVLEATAPRDGLIGTLHGYWLKHMIPLLGRLSPDPTAYQYLSESIFEFGDGRSFEAEMEAAGFEAIGARRFMLGATTLWAARWTGSPHPRATALGQEPPNWGPPPSGKLQNALPEWSKRGDLPHTQDPHTSEWKLWTGVQSTISLAVVITLGLGFQKFVEFGGLPSIEPWQRSGMRVLLSLGIVIFSARTLYLLVRFLGPARPR